MLEIFLRVVKYISNKFKMSSIKKKDDIFLPKRRCELIQDPVFRDVLASEQKSSAKPKFLPKRGLIKLQTDEEENQPTDNVRRKLNWNDGIPNTKKNEKSRLTLFNKENKAPNNKRITKSFHSNIKTTTRSSTAGIGSVVQNKNMYKITSKDRISGITSVCSSDFKRPKNPVVSKIPHKFVSKPDVNCTCSCIDSIAAQSKKIDVLLKQVGELSESVIKLNDLFENCLFSDIIMLNSAKKRTEPKGTIRVQNEPAVSVKPDKNSCSIRKDDRISIQEKLENKNSDTKNINLLPQSELSSQHKSNNTTIKSKIHTVKNLTTISENSELGISTSDENLKLVSSIEELNKMEEKDNTLEKLTINIKESNNLIVMENLSEVTWKSLPSGIAEEDMKSNNKEIESNSLSKNKSISKSLPSLFNFVEKKVETNYNDMRKELSFLCTPKNINHKTSLLFTPGTKADPIKLCSRKLQKQLFELNN